MLRAGVNKFHISRKPVALKPLPQVDETELFPVKSNVGAASSTDYSSAYREYEDNELLLSPNSAKDGEKSPTDKLPPKAFSTPNPSYWRLIVWQLIIFSSVFLIIFVPLYITRRVVYPLSQSAGNLPFFDCTYSGGFSFEGIDVPFGNLKFAEAKSIDLAFNTIVGRGLQTVVAAVCYRLFSAVLMHITESHRVSYKLYAALALAPTSTMSIKPTFKSLFTRLPGYAKLQLFWLLLTTVYLALFPTMMDSVSGYQAVQNTTLMLPNGTALRTPLYSDPGFLIADCDSPNGCVKIDKYVPLNGTVENVNFTLSVLGAISGEDENSPFVIGFEANLTFNPFGVNSRVAYFNGSKVYVSVCTDTTTSSIYLVDWTPLNQFSNNNGTYISKYTDPSCHNWYFFQEGFSTNSYICNLSSPSGSHYSEYDEYDESYHEYSVVMTPAWNFSYFRNPKNYECVSGANLQYQWGFSYEFLLIACCINGFWLLGTYAIYLHATTHSRLTNEVRNFGTWRAVLDLAEALREDLGCETCAYGEDELDGEIEKVDKEGPSIKYSVTGGDSDGDEEGDRMGDPRLGLSSFGNNGRVDMQFGRVYG